MGIVRPFCVPEDLIRAQREGGAIGEQAAIEVRDGGADGGGEIRAGGHVFPEAVEQDGEARRGLLADFQEIEEGLLGQQLDILGEHGEQAALEESGGDLRIVAVLFQGFREIGESFRDFPGHFRGVLGGIERMGSGPDRGSSGRGDPLGGCGGCADRGNVRTARRCRRTPHRYRSNTRHRRR